MSIICCFCQELCTLSRINEHMMATHFTHGLTEIKCFNCDEMLMCWNSWTDHQNEYHNSNNIKIDNNHQHEPIAAKFELNNAAEDIVLQTKSSILPESPQQQTKQNCYFCPLQINKKWLTNHIKRAHFKDNANQKCMHCEDAFDNWSSMQKHIKLMHDDDEEFDYYAAVPDIPILEAKACDICRKRFKNKSFLDMHMSTQHSTDKKTTILSSNTKIIKSKAMKKKNKSSAITPPVPSSSSNDPSLTDTDILFFCSFCSNMFNAKVKLLAHMKHGCIKEVTCHYCCFCTDGKYYDDTIAGHLYEDHFMDMIIPKLRKCLLCAYSDVQTYENWLKHIKDKHSANVVELFKAIILKDCKECHTGFKCYGQEDKHFELVHSIKNPYKCDKCSANFENQLLLNDHEELHMHSNVPICKFCHQIFQYQLDLELHIYGSITITENIEQNYFKCLQCNIISANSIHYDKHYEFHRKKIKQIAKNNTFQCLKSIQMDHEYIKIDNKTSSSSSKGKRSTCPYCDLKFTSHKTLKSHIKLMHTIEISALCWICGYLYETNELCEEHVELQHTNTNNSNIQQNLLINPTEFKEKKLLLNENEAAAVFKCTECTKSFRHKVNLESHMNMHTGDRPFSCDQCERVYTSKKILSTHKLRKHKKQNQPNYYIIEGLEDEYEVEAEPEEILS